MCGIKSNDLGMKLVSRNSHVFLLSIIFHIWCVSSMVQSQTCGLEILVSKVGGEGEGFMDVTSDPRWNTFVQSLKEKDYFQVKFIQQPFWARRDCT